MPPYDASFNGIASMIGVMFLLTSITLALRLVARYRQKIAFGADDAFAILSWIAFMGAIAVGIYGMSIHYLGYTTPSNPAMLVAIKKPITQALLSGLLMAIMTLGFGRLSAIFFFRRIFYTSKFDAFDIVTRAMIVILSLWTVGFFLSTLLSCGGNVSEWWAPNNTLVCVIYINQKGLAVSSFLLDFLVMIIPLPKIWMLHTTPTRKLAISAVFLMALSGLAASCTRMVILFLIENKGAAVNALDPFGANTRNYFYQLLETGSCLTAINLPSIWYFLRGLSPDKVLRSVRSLVSLRSTSSVTSDEKSAFKSQHNETMGVPYDGAVPSKRAQHELDSEERK